MCVYPQTCSWKSLFQITWQQRVKGGEGWRKLKQLHSGTSDSNENKIAVGNKNPCFVLKHVNLGSPPSDKNP